MKVDLYDLTSSDDPYPVYRELRDTYPVLRDEEQDFWVVSRYQEVRAVLLDPGLDLPEFGAYQRLLTLEIHSVHGNYDHAARCFSLNLEALEEFRVGGELRMAVDPHGFSHTRDKKQQ